jgi:hypothetical protein
MYDSMCGRRRHESKLIAIMSALTCFGPAKTAAHSKPSDGETAIAASTNRLPAPMSPPSQMAPAHAVLAMDHRSVALKASKKPSVEEQWRRPTTTFAKCKYTKQRLRV